MSKRDNLFLELLICVFEDGELLLVSEWLKYEIDRDAVLDYIGDRAPSLTTAGLKGYFNKRKRAENQGSSTNADKEGKVLAEKVAALEKDVEKTNLEKEKLVAQVKELESLLSAKEADVCEVFIQGFDRAVLQIKTLLPEADVSAMDVTKVALNGELVDGEVLEEAVDENAAQQQGDEVVRV
ncbi:hypothetical protein S245_050025 [Arachis hypogaea]